MNPSLRVTSLARADLFEIWEHVATDAGMDRADGVITTLEQAMSKVADSPGIGHRRPEIDEPQALVWVARPYLIVYRSTAQGVEVLRVLHGARDVGRLRSDS